MDNRVLGEYFPPERISALLESGLLGDVWDETNYAHKYSKQHHANQSQQLKAYLANYNPSTKVFTVKYVRGKDKYGRAVVLKALGLTAFQKRVRNTCIKDLYYDFDLCNAHPSIIKNICELYNIPCHEIVKYIEQRDFILQSISDAYGVAKNVAKKLMLRLCFFGTVAEWRKENNIDEKVKDPPFLQQFSNQLSSIALKVKEENETLYESCRRNKLLKRCGVMY